MLTALLPLASWATATAPTNGPAVGTAVGATIQISTSAGQKAGLVTYRVTGWAGVAANNDKDYYAVTITGLDADGLDELESGSIEL